MLVCLRAIACQRVGRSRVLENVFYFGSEERPTMLLLECSAEARYKPRYDNKRGIVTLNAGEPI